jgi:biopolymer transport protein ExbD
MAMAEARGETINDINTTPLIDVMLVLLIMLIITIPIQTHKVPIDLPVSAPREVPIRQANKLAIDAGGGLFWNGDPISEPVLAATLDRMTAMPEQPELQLQPDSEARYDVVDRVLALIKRANVQALGVIGNERYAQF